jgi:hypothetical protein
MIDVLFIAILGVVTLCVAREGAFGAATILIGVIFSGLLAMNFFEPLAVLLSQYVSSSPFLDSLWDIISLVGLFAVVMFLFRFITERLAPERIEMNVLVSETGRWGCALAAGYITMAFLATALHTGPFPRDFWGHFPPEIEQRTGPLGASGPDYQWLGFTQYVSEHAFRQGENGRVFDAPNYRVGNQEGEWSSFPIRYATRREALENSQKTTD